MKDNPHNKTYPGRCLKCYMREEVCICEHIIKIQNQIALTIVMHKREFRKTTNTGRLAVNLLEKSRILIRGLQEKPLSLQDHIQNPEKCFLLGFSPKATPLNEISKIDNLSDYQLVVPDGSWSNASRMLNREKLFKKMQLVQLPMGGPPSRYYLRKEPHVGGISTLEAIARAYGILESKKIQTHLESVFDIMVQNTLKTRPKNRQDENLKNR